MDQFTKPAIQIGSQEVVYQTFLKCICIVLSHVRQFGTGVKQDIRSTSEPDWSGVLQSEICLRDELELAPRATWFCGLINIAM